MKGRKIIVFNTLSESGQEGLDKFNARADVFIDEVHTQAAAIHYGGSAGSALVWHFVTVVYREKR